MPNYGDLPGGVGAVGQAATALYPGESLRLWNAEGPAVPASSIALTLALAPGQGYRPMVFDIEFSAAPTDSLLIQGAMTDTDSAYQTLYTSTNKQQDQYADQGSFLFYRCRIVSWTGGGTVTVTCSR